MRILLLTLCLLGAAQADVMDENSTVIDMNEEPTVEILDEGDFWYFTDEWREEYNDEQIARQPKWQLTPDQPEDGAYEIREYAPAWWVTSYTPCLNQTVAASFGYLKLYLYMNKYNSVSALYDLTYPILHKNEIAAVRPDPEGKEPRVRCPDRFSVNFYLPHPAGDGDSNNNPPDGLDESVLTSEEDSPKRRFVKRYEDTFTYDSNDVCNMQAGLLAIQLAMDGRRFNPNTYYCALYESGSSGVYGFEVWFDEFQE